MDRADNQDQIPIELEQYIALVKRKFDQMVETGEWPWDDKPDFDTLKD